MSAEYGGTRSAISDNAASKGTNRVFVNNDHRSATQAGFGGVLEKDDLKLDTVPISAIDHQSAILARSGGEVWKNRFPVDGISPLTIYKESGRPTGFDKNGLTGKNDCHFNLVWKTDNISP
jgi:hypothetical protein